ncbi:MAG: peptidylprolyl isomerase [Armatimonadetes bacterium]|nr:peptidylprolyl isomerase [Armatimonadota bacterium]
MNTQTAALLVVAALFLPILFGCGSDEDEGAGSPAGGAPGTPPPAVVKVAMEVQDRGMVTFELYPGKAPETCAQILDLIEKGFYDGQKIHRVLNWVTQWGDPQSKDLTPGDLRIGTGGSGNRLPFEETDLEMVRGVLAMASGGKKVGGDSQMFILKSDSAGLQGDYCGFGKVVEGMDVVDAIQPYDVIVSMRRLSAQPGAGSAE